MNKKKVQINKKAYSCDFCSQTFAYKSGKSRHQNYRCHMNTDLMNKTSRSDNNSAEVEDLKSEMNNMKEQFTLMTNAIKSLAQNGGLVHQNHIQTQNNTNIQHQTNNNINIYITEKIDFVQALRDIYGWDEAKAINHIKKRISQGDGGDIELFCDIYLFKDKENWPLIFKDKKTKHFLLKDANNNYIQDPGGVKLHDNFRSNYTDTLLRLSNREINSVLNSKQDPDFEFKRDYLMDDFDLQAVQNKAFKLCCKDGDSRERQTFIKKLSERIEIIEKQKDTNTITVI